MLQLQPLALQIFFQVTTATRALQRLAGMEVPTFKFDAASFQDLYTQIDQALECFEKARPEAFEGKEDMPVVIDVPNMWHFDLNGLTYLQEFVLPNLPTHWGLMAHYQDQEDVVEGVVELEKVKHELFTINAVKRREKE
ncbi:unnamed protein product [Alternaria alternata]